MDNLKIKATRRINKPKGKSIGLVMNFKTDATSGYVGEIVKGILWGLHEIGYDLKIISQEQFVASPDYIDNSGIEGAIVTHGSRDISADLRKEIGKKEGKIWPVVVINDYHPELRTNQLYVDSYKASLNMTSFLVKNGNKEFFIIGESKAEDAQARKKAIIETLEKNKIKISKNNCLNGYFSEEGGYLAAKDILESVSDFRGVLYCLNDAMAIGALRAIGEKGLICPRDIKIVGFDGIPHTEFTNPPITTMRFPLIEMGYHSVQIIYNINKGKATKPILKEFSGELLVRSSC